MKGVNKMKIGIGMNLRTVEFKVETKLEADILCSMFLAQWGDVQLQISEEEGDELNTALIFPLKHDITDPPLLEGTGGKMKQWLTATEMAKMYGVSAKTIKRWDEKGKFHKTMGEGRSKRYFNEHNEG